MNVDYNPFEGMEVKGEVTTVLSRGTCIIQDKKFTGTEGCGKYLKRKKHTSGDTSLGTIKSEVFN